MFKWLKNQDRDGDQRDKLVTEQELRNFKRQKLHPLNQLPQHLNPLLLLQKQNSFQVKVELLAVLMDQVCLSPLQMGFSFLLLHHTDDYDSAPKLTFPNPSRFAHPPFLGITDGLELARV